MKHVKTLLLGLVMFVMLPVALLGFIVGAIAVAFRVGSSGVDWLLS